MKYISLLVALCLCLSFAGCTEESSEEEVIVLTRTYQTTQNTTTEKADTTKADAVTSSTKNAASSATGSSATSSSSAASSSTVSSVSLPSVDVMKQDLNGLDVLALGDSLFRGTTTPEPKTTGEKVWINRLAKQCNWNITNLGIGGMTVSLTAANETNNKQSMYDKLFNTTDFVFGTANSTYYQDGDTKKSAADVDVIFLEGGCNDYTPQNNVPLGTVYSKDEGAFLGAYNLITDKLKKDYPNAVIVFLTTWELDDWTKRNDGVTSRRYSTSVKTLYEELYATDKRVALIDMGDPAVSGAQMNTASWRAEHAFDRFHLKEAGMNVVCENMLPHIWQVLKDKHVI